MPTSKKSAETCLEGPCLQTAVELADTGGSCPLLSSLFWCFPPVMLSLLSIFTVASVVLSLCVLGSSSPGQVFAVWRRMGSDPFGPPGEVASSCLNNHLFSLSRLPSLPRGGNQPCSARCGRCQIPARCGAVGAKSPLRSRGPRRPGGRFPLNRDRNGTIKT